MTETDIKPGQVWLGDERFPYQHGYKGDMAYVICSTDEQFKGERLWVCMNFQEWEYGAYKREFTESEIHLMEYIGHIKDLRK